MLHSMCVLFEWAQHGKSRATILCTFVFPTTIFHFYDTWTRIHITITHTDRQTYGQMDRQNYRKECIPVGCVPSAAEAVCWGCLLLGVCCTGGVSAPGGVWYGGCAPRGVVSQHTLRQTPLWTDMRKNITFATSLRTVKRRTELQTRDTDSQTDRWKELTWHKDPTEFTDKTDRWTDGQAKHRWVKKQWNREVDTDIYICNCICNTHVEENATYALVIDGWFLLTSTRYVLRRREAVLCKVEIWPVWEIS